MMERSRLLQLLELVSELVNLDEGTYQERRAALVAVADTSQLEDLEEFFSWFPGDEDWSKS